MSDPQYKDIDLIKKLIKEAQHSYIIAASAVGNRPEINLVLAKYADVVDSMVNYMDDRNDQFHDILPIQTDLYELIVRPLKITHDSIKHFLSPEKEKLFDPQVEKDPIVMKNKLIKSINDMIDVGNFNFQKISSYEEA